jgi:ribonuclease Z
MGRPQALSRQGDPSATRSRLDSSEPLRRELRLCDTVFVVEVVVLGSGTPNPDLDRAGSAVSIFDRDSWVLIDCGRGATLRAISAGLKLGELAGVFLTHHHSDHLSDLATLAIARWTSRCAGPLVVYAPEGPAARFADACLGAFDDDCFYSQADPAAGLRPRIDVRRFAPTGDVTNVMNTAGWTIRTTLVDHHPIEPAVGYRIERSGVKVMVSGDTRVCDGVRSLATGADVIVHEALLASRVSPALLEWNASSESVGALAAVVQPATLVLTHLIPAPASDDDHAAYLDDVRRGGFDGHTIVADDLTTVHATPRSD